MARCARALVVVLALTFVAACSDSSSGPSWVDAARASSSDDGAGTVTDDALSGAVGCEPLGLDDAPPTGPPPSGATPGAAVERGVGNDPFTATGARQVPGPGMALTPPPSEPVAVVVARPADPDEHVAARQPDGVTTGPVPAPKIIGAGGPTEPAPSQPTDGDDEAPDVPCQSFSGP